MSIEFTTGNLLEADVQAVVNTVNTVGVMGKGIALMFKEAFPENFLAYELACKEKRVQLGHMFVTKRQNLLGPKWIVNFPTKSHWRYPSKLEWIKQGLVDLKEFIIRENVQSIALPPLGAGNGGLDWSEVRPLIIQQFSNLQNVNITVYEPTSKYQNVAKRTGVEKLTIPRAMVAEMVRRYSIIGIACSILEVQKISYFLERLVLCSQLDNDFKFEFAANKYGPFSSKLNHLLNGLDGSYLQSDKRLTDSGPQDTIRFDDARADYVSAFLNTPTAKPYKNLLESAEKLIDGFQSPYGLELLATVDWLVNKEGVVPEVGAVREGLKNWFGGGIPAKRKTELFDERVVEIGLKRLREFDFA
jgi:O-acetyl-ADP-ribose deacetylase (regulator of RNase III)